MPGNGGSVGSDRVLVPTKFQLHKGYSKETNIKNSEQAQPYHLQA